MSFTILSCTGQDAARWQSLFDQLPPEYRDVFYTPAYARVQQSLGQGKAYTAVFVWQDFFILQPFMQRGSDLVSFYGGGGPISNLMDGASPRLWLWFDQEFAKWRQANKTTSEYVRLHPFFEKAQRRMLRESTLKLELLREAVTVKIDVCNEELLKSFSRNRQRGIKASHDIEVEQSLNMVMFATLYEKSLARLQALDGWKYPGHTWGNYQRLGDEYVTYFIARHHTDPTMLLVLHGYGKAYAHFIAGTQWNDILYYESMKYCRDVGCKTYLLGGGTTSSPDDSLLAYKSGFGSTRVPVYFYKREFTSERANVDSVAAQPA